MTLLNRSWTPEERLQIIEKLSNKALAHPAEALRIVEAIKDVASKHPSFLNAFLDGILNGIEAP